MTLGNSGNKIEYLNLKFFHCVPNRWSKKYILIRVLTVFYVLILTSICVYNVGFILASYFTFQTIITLHNEPPDVTDFPGITICAPTIFTPEKLAELYPKFNQSFQEYLEKERNQLINNWDINEMINRTQTFKNFETKALEEYSARDIIGKKSLQIEDILDQCQFNPVNLRHTYGIDNRYLIKPIDCTKLKPVLPSIYEGRKCFTFFSDLFEMKIDFENSYPVLPKQCPNGLCLDSKSTMYTNSRLEEKLFSLNNNNPTNDNLFAADYWHDKTTITPDSAKPQMTFDLNPNIEIRFNSESKPWSYLGRWNIMMTVHPPKVLPNRRDFLFFQVISNSFYEVNFTKKRIMLLPDPYTTGCINYKNDPFRTSDECRNICIKDFSYQANMCANYFSVLTSVRMFEGKYRDEHICGHHKQNYSLYLDAKNNCQFQCPEECESDMFELNSRVDTYLEEECLFQNVYSQNNQDDNNTESSESFQDCDTRVSIKISPTPFLFVTHQPAISYEEFIGNVGGHLGIWLGLSIYSLVNLNVYLIYNLLSKFFKCLSCVMSRCGKRIEPNNCFED